MRIPRALRWLLGITLPLLLLVLLFRWDWLIPIVESRASAALGRPVTVAHLHVRLGRVPEITLTDLRIANPDGFPADPPFALVPRAVISVEAWPLLREQRLVVPSVALHQPALELLGKEDGANNYTFEALAGGSGESGGGGGPLIRRVSIVEGRSHVALEALEADFNLQIATQEPEGQDPTVTLRAEGTYAAQPITGELVGGALLALQDAARPWPVRLQLANGPTRVTLEGTVQEPLALRGADLRLTLAGPDMKLLMPLTGVPIPTTPAYRVAGRLDFEEGRIRFREMQGTVGRTDLGGEIIIAPDAARPATEVPLAPAAGAAQPQRGARNQAPPPEPRAAATQAPPPGPAPNRRNTAQSTVPADRRPESTRPRPDITANLRSRRVDLNDLAGFIGGDPQPGQSNARPGRTLPDAPLSLPRIRAANIHLVYDGQRIEGRSMPLDNLHVKMDIVDGVIQIHPLRFGVGAGRIEAQSSLTPQEDGGLRTETQVSFQRIDISRLLGVTGAGQGAGTLGGRAQITGSGKSLAELLARGNGGVTLTMAGGEVSALLVDLAGLRLGNAIFSALGLPNRTRIECFVADLGLQRGVLSSRAILLDTEDVLITGTGNVSLAQERIDMRLNTDSKSLTIAALPTSFHITGSFADPSVAPDLTELGIRGGLAAALGFVAVPLAILPTIQFGIGDDPRCRNLVSQAGRTREQRGQPQRRR
ncbi:AsmA family protein [Roseococcus sp. SYP-B2431]|uniref:AsmA family protein n=1 Tax=Roseococcus sp. SYP-B2431 TaxID=2496640 RepID=UPI0010CF14E5|nr:AsmA family protein [Roseococcus sp. SYP-B2431]TCH98762.1 AsmA family protein [Roseococcus sp. SYP-B2431]